MDIAIVIFQIFVAVVWIQQGIVRYGFWVDGKPGGGFVPVVFAALVLGAAIIILIRGVFGKKSTQEPHRFQVGAYLPAAAAVIGAFMIQVLGITAAVFFFVMIWMRYLSKYSWLKTLLSSAIFTLFIYGVFRFWLHVPFPKGLIYELF